MRCFQAPGSSDSRFRQWYNKVVVELVGHPFPPLAYSNMEPNRKMIHNVLLSEARSDECSIKYFCQSPNIFWKLSNNFRYTNFKYFFRRELRLQKEAEKRTETMNNVSKSVNLEEEIDWVSDLRTKKSEYWKFIVSSDPNAFSHSHHNKKIVSCCCVGVDCVRHSSAVKS